MAREALPAYCALCISRCGCVGTVEDGVLTRVDADPLHPTGQALCVKAKAAPEAVCDPTRILYPLCRTLPKGEADPDWERISWDEALDWVAAKMGAALVEMHPDTAAARGIRAGDWVEVATAMAHMGARARLDAHLAPEVVCAQYGWWQFPDGAGDANRLMDGERFDPVAGSNGLRHAPCQVSLGSAPTPAPCE